MNHSIRQLFDVEWEGKTMAGMDRVPEAMAETLRQAGLSVTYDRDNSDYVYRREDLAELRGRKYSKKRNHVKKVLARHLCRYEEIGDALIKPCLAFQHRWCEMRQCGRDPGLCEEYKAIVETLERFRELGVFGGAIFVEDDIRAFTVGEALSRETAVVHFEKADPTMDGLSQLINHWFCQKSLSAFEYVNREQDLGIPGLRQAKESYYPHHLVNKYKATLPTETHAPCSKAMG
jgi:hypothetical protein